MTNKHTILSQKKLRVESEISGQVAETTDVEREIHRLRIDLLRLNTIRHKERGNENSLERDNMLLESQFMRELKVGLHERQIQSSFGKDSIMESIVFGQIKTTYRVHGPVGFRTFYTMGLNYCILNQYEEIQL